MAQTMCRVVWAQPAIPNPYCRLVEACRTCKRPYLYVLRGWMRLDMDGGGSRECFGTVTWCNLGHKKIVDVYNV
jgi:hypothetical protein